MMRARLETRGTATWWLCVCVVVAGLSGCKAPSPAAPTVPQPTPPVVVTPPPPEPAGPVEVPPPAPAPPPTLAVSRIVAFGDSLTEGVASAPTFSLWSLVEVPQSYPFKLRTRIVERYASQTFSVLNAGKAGELAEDGVERFADVLEATQPEVVLLMDGANDLTTQGRRGIPRAIGAVETMIKEANRRGVQVFLATLPPERAGSPKGSAGPYLAEYNAELAKTALDEGARLVDVGAAINLTEIGADGLHPTEAGYDHVAAVFLEALARAFERPGAVRRATAARR